MSVDQVQQSEQGIPDLHEHDDGVSQLLQDNLNVSSYLLDLRHFFSSVHLQTYAREA